jgi:hypothetical protein
MPKCTLRVSAVGQLEEAEIRFGDLTVLVGPQATGKSIFLELFKLVTDTGAVLAELRRYGLDWSKDGHKDVGRFLGVYLGEGMQGIWREGRSAMAFNGRAVDLKRLVSRQRPRREESTFFIPAQRVLTLARGWPRPFTDYGPGDPFAVRDFSEKIRRLMESGIGSAESLFPQTRRLKKQIRDSLEKTVFSGYQLRVDKYGAQKRLVLSPPGEGGPLPFMVWSAGQREFVPLLLGLYWLLPPTKTPRRGNIEWAVVEEVEMGLHPKAISTVLLLVLDLLARGYRVCMSTHSPHVLDVVWALKVFQQHHAPPQRVLDLFQVSRRQDMVNMAERVLEKEARVYYFDPQSGRTREISNLDPGSDDLAEAGWGGLAEFSGHVSDVVAEVVAGSTQ